MKDFTQIPENALVFSACEFALGDNGENAKTAPVRLKARSGQPIEHWYWGRVVHDLAGMKLAKKRIPIDYVHSDNEVIGFINHFDIETGDLFLSGALVPFKDSDRATEIIYKQKNGVPYESSINFAGAGIKVQEIGEGELTEVNGYQFQGPGVVIREWPLRGVAICPYGADGNTDATVFNNSNKMFSAVVIAPEAETQKGESQMSEQDKPVAVEEPVKELTETAETEETVETETEAKPEELVAVEVEAEVETAEPMSVEEFKRVKNEFGAEIAAEVFAACGTYEDALKLAYEKTKAELEGAKAKLSEASTAGGGTPVKAQSIPQNEKSLRKLCETGTRKRA